MRYGLIVAIGHFYKKILRISRKKDFGGRSWGIFIFEWVLSMYESSNYIAVLLDNLLSWARNQNNYLIPEKKAFDLSPLVDEVGILNSQRLLEKKILFQNEIPENTEIFADKDMIDLVFRNLIDNAIKYTPEDGEIKIHSQKGNSSLKVLVTDTGIGLKKEERYPECMRL